MTLPVTHHGQTDSQRDHPVGDPYLSDLGKKQAGLLGHALKEHGFDGMIYSSPYFRTMATAQIIAEVTDSVVLPTPEMRECVIRDDQMEHFHGATMGELSATYIRVTGENPFTYPWWTREIETEEGIEARVSPLVDRVARMEGNAKTRAEVLGERGV